MSPSSSPPATRLYSPALLALATDLAAYRLDDGFPLRAQARSRTCGSAITLGLEPGAGGTIARVGMQVQACAIGQASAALLAQGALARPAAALAQMADSLAAWLSEEGALPDWPGLTQIAPARDHPARHGALLLPWTAARLALSSGAPAS